MSCFMYIKEMRDAPVKTTGAWADLSPYQKLLKENEQWHVDYTEARMEIAELKEEIKKLHELLPCGGYQAKKGEVNE